MKKRRIKHNDLTHYFLREHSTLPRAYLASCEKFFYNLKLKKDIERLKKRVRAQASKRPSSQA